ncbi:hypothetical protein CRG98_034433 [Punica granatum]|uniref:Uncharacterized protein n=1 Tax=Punica granatum TaxID=22663 RepID=A0A2I0IMG0_PUNGR|nr:hypothetical protein CRG98_034433 [Punica granatum]
MISGDSFSCMSVTRPHEKVDTPKPRDPKVFDAGPKEGPHSGPYKARRICEKHERGGSGAWARPGGVLQYARGTYRMNCICSQALTQWTCGVHGKSRRSFAICTRRISNELHLFTSAYPMDLWGARARPSGVFVKSTSEVTQRNVHRRGGPAQLQGTSTVTRRICEEMCTGEVVRHSCKARVRLLGGFVKYEGNVHRRGGLAQLQGTSEIFPRIEVVVLGMRQTCICQKEIPFGVYILIPAYGNMGANNGCQSYRTVIMEMCKEV